MKGSVTLQNLVQPKVGLYDRQTESKEKLPLRILSGLAAKSSENSPFLFTFDSVVEEPTVLEDKSISFSTGMEYSGFAEKKIIFRTGVSLINIGENICLAIGADYVLTQKIVISGAYNLYTSMNNHFGNFTLGIRGSLK